MNKIGVLLADDHTIVRKGIRVLLASEADIEVVGEAETGRQAIRLSRKLRPDVVVMDVAMPSLNGLEATRQIVRECPHTKVLILSMHSDEEYVHKLVDAGASGYLVKKTAAADLLAGIREIHAGNVYFSPSIAKLLLRHYRDRISVGASEKATLTPRELEVLQLIAESFSNKEIAAELCVSIKTVEKHRQQIMDKLDIHNVAGLTRYAIAHGITSI